MTEKNLVKNTGNLAGTKNSACDNTGNLIVKLIELTTCVVSSAVAFKTCNTIDSIMLLGLSLSAIAEIFIVTCANIDFLEIYKHRNKLE